MRLFIAINLNEEIKNYLMAAIQDLKAAATGGNFTRRENLHLTLAFLGELSPDKVASIKSAMDRVKGEPLLLSLSGFGKFRRRGGNIHWAGVGKNEALYSVQRQLTAELIKEGFSLEDREYSPHLTLGREVRLTSQDVEPFGDFSGVEKEMIVSRISLMKSERIAGKLIYSEVYGRDFI